MVGLISKEFWMEYDCCFVNCCLPGIWHPYHGLTGHYLGDVSYHHAECVCLLPGTQVKLCINSIQLHFGLDNLQLVGCAASRTDILLYPYTFHSGLLYLWIKLNNMYEHVLWCPGRLLGSELHIVTRTFPEGNGSKRIFSFWLSVRSTLVIDVN